MFCFTLPGSFFLNNSPYNQAFYQYISEKKKNGTSYENSKSDNDKAVLNTRNVYTDDMASL